MPNRTSPWLQYRMFRIRPGQEAVEVPVSFALYDNEGTPGGGCIPRNYLEQEPEQEDDDGPAEH